ncbi:uridine permease Fui1 [Moesziomyces antarcticus]|uniref:Uridine permease Fui1 n=2 Tax=Pseudozyma antarctica TaxID=84753 RepID=A0A081CH24_PSEA2|nr:uridine permease Fui1 [Moesziomyces antarcticus]GAK65970.1 uridine permease Fui1 [Moesziomyces antarcticus]SPO46744.1 probable uracil permease [Moesziomyces antarcticus]
MSLVKRTINAVAIKGSERRPGESRGNAMLRNADLLPVAPDRRTWGWMNFAAFWISDGLNLNTFMIASTAVSAGLTWSQAWAAIIVGYFVVALLVVATARIGAVYHVSFPILARSTFGVWGAIWPIINRSAMACIWYGVQAYIGGQCVTLVLRSMFPSYARMPNHLPASAGITTMDFVSFFLFSLISLPLVVIHPTKIRFFFNFKSVVVPIAAIAFFAWSIADAKGLGPIVNQPATLKGSAFGWQFVASLMSCISNMATLVLNIPDISRMAKNKRSVTWSQILAIPLTFSLTSFLGIIIASSSHVIYGELIWNPVDLLGERLKLDPYNSGARAGVFFIAFAFIIGQIGVNIAANSLSAGHDLAAACPRFINIRRGSLVAAAVGFAMCPWNLLKDSNNFATYLSAYSLFLSSISGTMMADYYVVRRGKLDVPSLFSASSGKTDGQPHAYHYWHGINLRAFAAYVAGIAMTVAGFAGVLGAEVSVVAHRMYILAYPIGFLVSALVYIGLCEVFPVVGGVSVRAHKDFLEPESWESDMWEGAPIEGLDAAADASATTSDIEKASATDHKSPTHQQQVLSTEYYLQK